ncbi:sodium:solute symporter family protein [Rhodopirellula sallentina]|uniref:Sodium/solute symporter family protein glucose transporter n=1 Tax=Rhodopirellula sallentina SM41 TaxID=1263870 RepID=M5TSK3_9BACT|nr:sodium:solute symporter family protein [Rhodopirellula sallentina]EMI52172.1 sodium/solute symporter family protein glucose transporter [Rhodopirellula sallentina SM41]
MTLSLVDYSIIAAFFVISTVIGIVVSRRAGKSFTEYFLAGGQMSWWMLGISMVATTFAADTPNLVTNIVRRDGVSGNWVWWAFLLTGLLTVFVYAKLWKRSGISTDLEFYELRYSGKAAGFLRGFRAIYLGVVFNCLVMANVILAGIKLGGVLLGASPLEVVCVAGTVTVVYTLLGGLRGVILTDCFQFVVAMFGSVAAAYVVCNLPEVGGLTALLSHESVHEKMNLLPDASDFDALVPLMIVPLAVQWWSGWYPGAEPGGGGYVAQRMLGARSERDATTATLLFQMTHYALRPWPWILVALASIVVYPSLESIQVAFPDIDPSIVQDDLAYPAMLTFLPSGLLGLVIASLIAAFMSTISTHLNWGASYIAHDFYRRFFNPAATDSQLVRTGRLATVGLMILASVVALTLESAMEGFGIILQIGAGTGLIYILRWFWWRINAFTEITGMAVSFAVAVFFKFGYHLTGWPELNSWQQLLAGVAVTSAAWIAATFLSPSTDREKLESFYQKIRPGGSGWGPIRSELLAKGIQIETADSITTGLAAMLAATTLVYAALFSTGYFLYQWWGYFAASTAVGLVSLVCLVRTWPSLNFSGRDSSSDHRAD